MASPDEPVTTAVVDESLRRRVLARLGRTSGLVTVHSEQWDLGLCATCSFPESGFSVRVDGEQVWPNDDLLLADGGYGQGDGQGQVAVKPTPEGPRQVLTSWGRFFTWLAGADLPLLSEAEDMVYWSEQGTSTGWPSQGEVEEALASNPYLKRAEGGKLFVAAPTL